MDNNEFKNIILKSVNVDIDKELNNIKRYVKNLENKNDELQNELREYNKDKEIQKMKEELDDISNNSVYILNEQEQQDYDRFRKEHWQKCNGKTEFIISGNEIGNSITCRCGKCGIEEDITDVSTW